jgi:hypothetical protein
MCMNSFDIDEKRVPCVCINPKCYYHSHLHTDTLPQDDICADIPTGDKIKTIIVGAHSDRVLNGSKPNDNSENSIDTS